MRSMEEINQEYREYCTVLGDVEVKMKGLANQKEAIFNKLVELDKEAAKHAELQEMKMKEAEAAAQRAQAAQKEAEGKDSEVK